MSTRARQGGQVADLLAVNVGRDEVVDAVDAGVLHGVLDPQGVALIGASPAGVYKDRLPRGRDTSVAAPPSTSIQ